MDMLIEKWDIYDSNKKERGEMIDKYLEYRILHHGEFVGHSIEDKIKKAYRVFNLIEHNLLYDKFDEEDMKIMELQDMNWKKYEFQIDITDEMMIRAFEYEKEHPEEFDNLSADELNIKEADLFNRINKELEENGFVYDHIISEGKIVHDEWNYFEMIIREAEPVMEAEYKYEKEHPEQFDGLSAKEKLDKITEIMDII